MGVKKNFKKLIKNNRFNSNPPQKLHQVPRALIFLRTIELFLATLLINGLNACDYFDIYNYSTAFYWAEAPAGLLFDLEFHLVRHRQHQRLIWAKNNLIVSVDVHKCGLVSSNPIFCSDKIRLLGTHACKGTIACLYNKFVFLRKFY